MGLFGNFVRSLAPGNDHELAATQYAGRESASARGDRSKTFGRPSRSARDADRQGQAWEERDRQQHPSTTPWFRRRS
jgi:hypothetical protein